MAGLQEGDWEGLFLKRKEKFHSEANSRSSLSQPSHPSLVQLYPGKYLMWLQQSCELRPSLWSCCSG